MKKQKVLIWGVNGYGKKVRYLLDDEKYEFVGWIDNFSGIQGKEKCPLGGDCYSPNDIYHLDFDRIIIAINRHDKNMRNQLVDLYGENILQKVITFEPYENGMKWLEERHAMLRLCAEEIQRYHVVGSVAELGVYKGEFARFINRFFPDRKLYLFDTFDGFDEADKSSIKEIGFSEQGFTFEDTSVSEVLDKMPHKNQVIVRKGYFPGTSTGLENEAYAFVSIDADLYNPIRAGLEYFYPRLSHGGYIFVHDFGVYSFTGCQKAVREFCEREHISYVPILDNCLSVIITK